MKIKYRVKTNTNIGKWADKPKENKNHLFCDMCGAKLWVAPDGKTIYCDNEHDKRG